VVEPFCWRTLDQASRRDRPRKDPLAPPTGPMARMCSPGEYFAEKSAATLLLYGERSSIRRPVGPHHTRSEIQVLRAKTMVAGLVTYDDRQGCAVLQRSSIFQGDWGVKLSDASLSDVSLANGRGAGNHDHRRRVGFQPGPELAAPLPRIAIPGLIPVDGRPMARAAIGPARGKTARPRCRRCFRPRRDLCRSAVQGWQSVEGQ